MTYGLFSAILWALETVFVGLCLIGISKITFPSIFLLAPFVVTFLHDTVSALSMIIYHTINKNWIDIRKVLLTKNSLIVIFAAMVGGPIGMTGYILTIQFMGPAVGAVASSIYPAIGATFAYIFLKEVLQKYKLFLLLVTLLGVLGLSYTPGLEIKNFGIGLLGILMCSFGWGMEAVMLSKSFEDSRMKDEYALLLRQLTSSVFYAIVIFPILGYKSILLSGLILEHFELTVFLLLGAVFATISYLCYYKAINNIGPSKAMAINITYSAWAVVFQGVINRSFSFISGITATCILIVIISGVLIAIDLEK